MALVNINDICHSFYNTALARVDPIDTPTAIYLWLEAQGFTQAHTSDRWKALADSISYQYVGDIDIQNKIATGELTFP